MAARLRKRHQDDVREKIRLSQLLNRLEEHALSIDPDGLGQTQVRAIEILLKKCLPDLSQIEHTGDPENPVTVAQVEFIRPGKDVDTDPGKA